MDTPPPVPLADCEVLAAASGVASAFADTASANLKSLSSAGTPRLMPFDARQMADALATKVDGVILHHVLYAATNDGKLAPFSLMNLWSLHANLVFANAMANLPAPKPDHAKAINQAIRVESLYLAEAYAYASEVCRVGLGPQIMMFVRARRVPGIDAVGNPLGSALSNLVERHKTNIDGLKLRLRTEIPDQPAVAERIATLSPIGLPVWLTMKDEPGARVINDVWFPKLYAEPLMKSLAEEQAKAMSR